MEQNLVKLDKLVINTTTDQFGKHTMDVNKQIDSSLELKTEATDQAHQAMTSAFSNKFVQNLVKLVSYSKTKLNRAPNCFPAEVNPPDGDGTLSKVARENNEPRFCFIGDTIFCSCLVQVWIPLSPYHPS